MVIESDMISRLLPHKYPFLLVDRVIEVDPGKSIRAIKNVTINEPYFTGHFPGRPIVPGVLLLESLAQTAALMYTAEALQAEGIDLDHLKEADLDYEKIANKVGYLISIKNVKFMKIVTPGDTLVLHAVRKVKLNNLSQIEVDASVGSDVVVKGTISVSEAVE